MLPGFHIEKFDVDLSGIEGAIEKNIPQATKTLMSIILDDSNFFIPKDTGALERSGRVDYDTLEIVWDIIYARRLYFGEGMQIRRNTNPAASPQWFEKARAEHEDNWLDIFGQVLTEGF